MPMRSYFQWPGPTYGAWRVVWTTVLATFFFAVGHAADPPDQVYPPASAPQPLWMLTVADQHKFTLANNSGGLIGVIQNVSIYNKEGVETYSLYPFIYAGAVTIRGSSITNFIKSDQDYIKKWAAEHATQGRPAAVLPPGTIGIAVLSPPLLQDITDCPYMVDNTGVLKGKTITAVSGLGLDMKILCSDGTLAACGEDTNGGLGDDHHDAKYSSFVPVLMDTSGGLKGKKVISIQSDRILCADGSVYSIIHDRLELYEVGPLKGKKVTAVVQNSFFCSDGTIVTEATRDMPAQVLDQGILKGKTVTFSGGFGDRGVILCSDGTLAQWGIPRELGASPLTNVPPVGAAVPIPLTILPDAAGVLTGKTLAAISNFPFNGGFVALYSDGTMAAWAGRTKAPPPNNNTRGARGAPPNSTGTGNGRGSRGQALTPAKSAPSVVTLNADGTIPLDPLSREYATPIIVSGTGVLQGKTVTAIHYGLILCSDGTLAWWYGDGPPVSADPHGALKGKKILQLGEHVVIFQEPIPGAAQGATPEPPPQ